MTEREMADGSWQRLKPLFGPDQPPKIGDCPQRIRMTNPRASTPAFNLGTPRPIPTHFTIDYPRVMLRWVRRNDGMILQQTAFDGWGNPVWIDVQIEEEE